MLILLKILLLSKITQSGHTDDDDDDEEEEEKETVIQTWTGTVWSDG